MENRRRQIQFKVRLLEEEATILEVKAQDARMTRSDYIRNLIVFGYAKDRTVFTKEDSAKIRKELNRIGANINQIAMQINMNKSGFSQEYRTLIGQYLELLSEYQQIFKVENYGDNKNHED